MRKEKQRILSFKEAVELTPDVATNYCFGLEAFGYYKFKIKVPNTTKIDGSLDIDESTKKLYPNENRWDYALSYNGEVFYIEIHSAKTDEVAKMIRKLRWLKSWLTLKAPEIKKLTTTTKQPYYWVQTSKCSIPKHMPQYKTVVQNKILPMSVWDYSKIFKKEK